MVNLINNEIIENDLSHLYTQSDSLRFVDDFIEPSLQDRSWILEKLPKNSVGAELGVFTGAFSEKIIQIVKVRKLYLVDLWDLQGEYYGNWGKYTNFGKLKTKDAMKATCLRSKKYGNSQIEIMRGDSLEWISTLRDRYLDWVYIDTTHSYRQTLNEIKAASPKIKDNGFILGDDWHADYDHKHVGVTLAVNDFIRMSNYDLLCGGPNSQWLLQKRPQDAHRITSEHSPNA